MCRPSGRRWLLLRHVYGGQVRGEDERVREHFYLFMEGKVGGGRSCMCVFGGFIVLVTGLNCIVCRETELRNVYGAFARSELRSPRFVSFVVDASAIPHCCC